MVFGFLEFGPLSLCLEFRKHFEVTFLGEKASQL